MWLCSWRIPGSERISDPRGEIGIGVQDQENTSHTYSANGLLTLYLAEWGQIVGLLLEWRYETFRSVNNLPELRGEPQMLVRCNVEPTSLWRWDEILLLKERLSIRPLLRYNSLTATLGLNQVLALYAWTALGTIKNTSSAPVWA